MEMDHMPCATHGVPVSLWCCRHETLVCYNCLLFGDHQLCHQEQQCYDEEKTR